MKAESLNKGQLTAVQRALVSEDVFLVHGPPGCGSESRIPFALVNAIHSSFMPETTVLVRIIQEAVKRGRRVLAWYDTDNADDDDDDDDIELGITVGNC